TKGPSAPKRRTLALAGVAIAMLVVAGLAIAMSRRTAPSPADSAPAAEGRSLEPASVSRPVAEPAIAPAVEPASEPTPPSATPSASAAAPEAVRAPASSGVRPAAHAPASAQTKPAAPSAPPPTPAQTTKKNPLDIGLK